MTLRRKVCEQEKCGLEEFSGDRKESYLREKGKQGCGFAFASSQAPRECLTLKGELQGGHHGLPDLPQDGPIDVGSKSLKSKGFLENLCRVFDKEREGKGEEVQSFA